MGDLVTLCDCGKPTESLVCACGVTGCGECRYEAPCCGRIVCRSCANDFDICRGCYGDGDPPWEAADPYQLDDPAFQAACRAYVEQHKGAVPCRGCKDPCSPSVGFCPECNEEPGTGLRPPVTQQKAAYPDAPPASGGDA